jgi:integrase
MQFTALVATNLLEAGYDIRTIQELLNHRDVKTTMTYTDILNSGPGWRLQPLRRKVRLGQTLKTIVEEFYAASLH